MKWWIAASFLVEYLIVLHRVQFHVSSMSVDDYDDEYWQELQQMTNDSDYGKTWTYMPDGYGIPRIALLTEPPQNSRLTMANGGVSFYLYTKNHDRTGKELAEIGAAKQEFGADFDPLKKTVFLVHGWMASEDIGGILNIRESYIKWQDANVITVGWKDLAASFYYFESARRTNDVGREIAALIDYMVTEMNLNLSTVHIIGHSLGAHTAGYAGSYVKSGQVSRITGLDPAGPYFYLKGPENRLDESDAKFVDVIHTAVGTAGHYKNLGHVDFFPNGGIYQPGCGQTIILKESCSHSRAQEFYAESLFNNEFFGYPCNSFRSLQTGNCDMTKYEMMGAHVSPEASGKYYVEVGKSSPYAMGAKHTNCDE